MAEPLPGDTILKMAEAERRAHPEWESGGGGLVSSLARLCPVCPDDPQRRRTRRQTVSYPAAFKSDDIRSCRAGFRRCAGLLLLSRRRLRLRYGFAVRTDPGNAKPPPPGSIGELKWDSGSGTYFGVDPHLDMIYILLVQTQNERARITPAFKKLVYDAFAADK